MSRAADGPARPLVARQGEGRHGLRGHVPWRVHDGSEQRESWAVPVPATVCWLDGATHPAPRSTVMALRVLRVAHGTPMRRHRARLAAAGSVRLGACATLAVRAPVAQWTRACGFGPQGRGFESLRARSRNLWPSIHVHVVARRGPQGQVAPGDGRHAADVRHTTGEAVEDTFLRYSPSMTARTARARRPPIGFDASAQLEAVREILRAISRAPFDLEGVLGIVVERAASLCSAELGMVFVPDHEGFYRGAAAWGMKPEHAAYEMQHQTPITQGTVVGRVVLSGDTVQIEDAASDPTYTWMEGRRIGGFRTIMGLPIRTGDQLIGVVNLARNEVRRFSDEEIELVRTFADQAAIVLANVRLLGTIDRQREELARYLPSTVAELLSSAQGEQLLAGHRREVSVVFCDLRGFTAFAEAAEPEEVLDVLREYHREMGAIVVARGGTLEHFAGDGMMIFLNDPKPVVEHTAEAVRMALQMRERFGEIADGWRRQGFDLGLGVGVSVGYATLGRIGFEGHFGYAVIGTVANLAARLCAIAQPGQIVLSERAYTRVEPLVEAEALGPMELKGFRRPVEAYAVSALRLGS